jgi:hypothetical protein
VDRLGCCVRIVGEVDVQRLHYGLETTLSSDVDRFVPLIDDHLLCMWVPVVCHPPVCALGYPVEGLLLEACDEGRYCGGNGGLWQDFNGIAQ